MKPFTAWMLLFLAVAAAIVWLVMVVELPQPAVGFAVAAVIVPLVVLAGIALRRRLPRR